MLGNLHVRFGGGQLEKGLERSTSLAAYPTQTAGGKIGRCSPAFGVARCLPPVKRGHYAAIRGYSLIKSQRKQVLFSLNLRVFEGIFP
ncbi:hypothetical protein U27_00984 [Candidatus Vecturithrix granuli]|uniref:Uncharacterized protein n=1 Tax=Vecturithrix granuli TaxID=1499967 RepID=A0A081C931_VECG1|nr:hypothetical protein U27_00984 [Candidatus Vecturithrix granuli]